MEETKRCPYCGEEILAVAKKCKHCGEWLEEKPHQDAVTSPRIESKKIPIRVAEDSVDSNDEELFSKNIPLSNTVIQWLFWAAIIGLLITTAHALVPDGDMLNTSIGAGKTRIFAAILNFFSTIPEWIGEVLETFGLVVMLMTLLQILSKMKESFANIFEWLITAICIGTGCSILIDFMDDATPLFIVCVICLAAQYILQIILGIKISTLYTGRINYLGRVIYICGGVECLILLVHSFSFMLVENEDTLYWINFSFLLIDAIVLYCYYLSLKTILLHIEKE